MKGLESVKEYYGKILQSSQDLKTNACCLTDSMPKYLREILKDVHEEVKDKFYGCGSPIPLALEGMTVLDLGSGSGRDCYLLSKLVGPRGKVIGIDMTDEQIEVAKKHMDYHAKKFGQAHSNVEFRKGYIEDLEGAGIQSNSIDIVISNCVINLSPAKERVFSEIFRVLKPGGELYFSDIFANRRMPESLVQNSVLMGECLSGAMYTEDFRRLMGKLGCMDFRITGQSPVTIQNSDIEAMVGLIKFTSMTIRAFKIDLEDKCEDYGQLATYKGNMPENAQFFILDDHHLFEKNKPVAICKNTALMLSDSRYGQFFHVTPPAAEHFGLFDCGVIGPSSQSNSASGACC